LPEKSSFLPDKADPESTVKHVDPWGICDLVTFF